MKDQGSYRPKGSEQRDQDRLGSAGSSVDASSAALASAIAAAAPFAFGKTTESEGTRLNELGEQLDALTQVMSKPELVKEQLVKQMPVEQAEAFQQLLATLTNPEAALLDAIGPEALMGLGDVNASTEGLNEEQLQEMIDSLTTQVNSLRDIFDPLDPDLASAVADQVATLSTADTTDLAVTVTEASSNLTDELGSALDPETLSNFLDETGLGDTSGLTDGLVDVINVLPDTPLSGGDNTIIDDVIGDGSQLIEDLLDPVPDVVDDVVDSVTDVVDDVVDSVIDVTDPIVDPITDAVDSVVDTVTDVTDPIVDPITDAVDSVVDTVTDLTDPIVDPITDVVDSVVDTVTDVTDPVTDGLLGGGEGGLLGSLTSQLSASEGGDGLDLGGLSTGIASTAGGTTEGGLPNLGSDLDKI